MTDQMTPVPMQDLPPIAMRAIAAVFANPEEEVMLCDCLSAEVGTASALDGHAIAYMGMLSCRECCLGALQMLLDTGIPFECDGCGEMTSYPEGAQTPSWFVEDSMLAVSARACPACSDALARCEKHGKQDPAA